jgi:hypothetical protein
VKETIARKIQPASSLVWGTTCPKMMGMKKPMPIPGTHNALVGTAGMTASRAASAISAISAACSAARSNLAPSSASVSDGGEDS